MHVRTPGQFAAPVRPGRSSGARLRLALVLAMLVTGLVGSAGAALAQEADDTTVAITEVRGVITPVVADHLTDAIRRAAAEGHEALVVTLDTPGGLITSTEVIVQHLLGAELPVVVYVTPQGANATSAGTFITMAAHVAAMAPATTIGAATPVDMEGQEAVSDKILNAMASRAEAIAQARDRDAEFAIQAVREGRSITATEALEIGAIDLVSNSLPALLDEIDGWEVALDDDEIVTLATANATLVELEWSTARQILQLLADPNLAFIFLSLGTLAILYEIANPGLGLGGFIGIVLIVLAMFSLAVLPVNYAGAALLLLAAAMFIAELFMPGVGVGAAGGTIALLLGGIFLFEEQTGVVVDWWVLIPTVLIMFGLTVLAGRLVWRTRYKASRVASDFLIGRTVTIEHTDGQRFRGHLDGTSWTLRPEHDDLQLMDGDEVEVVGRDNLELLVRPVERRRRPGASTGTSSVPPDRDPA